MFGVFEKPFARQLAYSLVIFSVTLQFIFVCVKPQQLHTMRTFGSAKFGEAPWFSEIKLFAYKLEGKSEIYNLVHFGGEDRSVDLTPYRSMQGFNFWWAHLRRARHSAGETTLAAQPFPLEWNRDLTSRLGSVR